jgi:PAS domain S-box-containing protein
VERTRLEDERPEAGIVVDHASVVHDAGDTARRSRDLLKRYGVALALSGLALGIRAALPVPVGTTIYQLPLVAVVLSGWLGGRGPGLFASIICITGVFYWFLPPVNTLDVAAGYQLPFAIFIGLCLLLTEFSGARRRTEQALRASEERFRALMQFSFDVYWETDAQHRFTRQEFSERLADAPARRSEIGKTRWEVPYLEPDEEAWRKHRATLDAHLPFRDFELARPTADGGKRYVSVSGLPVFDEAGRFVGYRGVGRHITERKRVEVELRSRQELLDLAQKAARAVAFDWYIGARESENRWSPYLEAMYGLEPGTFDGTYQGWKKLVHPDDWPAVKLAIKRAHDSGDIDAEYRVIHKDGRVHWLRAKGRMFFDSQAQPERMVGFMIDVTDRRQAEEELRASEARVRTFVDRATDAFFLMDEQIRVVDVNRQACDSLGWSREELIGMYPGEFDVALDEPSIQRLAQRARAGEIITFETRHRRKDGTTFPVEVRSGTFEQGGKLFYLALARDISERKQAEESLRQSEAYLTEAQRLSHTGSWAFDVASNRYVYTSEESDRIFGIDPHGEKPTREVIFERIHPEDRSSWKRNLEKSLREKVDTTDQYRVVLPNGEVRHIHTIRHPVVNSAGEVVKLIGTSIDITERKRAEEELRASEARFRTFVDRATDAFFLHDQQLRLIDVNRQASESLGYSREELIGMHPLEYDVDLDEATMRRLADRLAAGEVVTFETRHRRKDGAVFPVEIRTGTFKQGEERFYLALARDITERRHAEEALREKDYALQMARTELAHVSRLTTLGELTTSIVHEVSQPLGAMINSAAAGARWLAAEPPALSEARVALDNIAADGKRAREVIARIRALTKRQAPRMGLLDLNRKIAEVVSFAEHELRSHHIVLKTKLDSKLPQVAGDRVQLQQVLLNLIINAIEAMSAVNNRPRELTINSARGADGVLVEVCDSGVGLEAQDAERVFDAFYTTKSEGIGIGLSISRSIVEAHGGRLSASANQPYGAVFRFSLPIAEEGHS